MSILDNQQDLFSDPNEAKKAVEASPLAFRARPENLAEYCGQDHLFSRWKFLQNKNFPSLIIWGPPGTGKTTLAGLLADQSGKELFKFNAVLGGVADLKKLISQAREMKQYFGKESIIFVDEIHRFNKAQQDALLPYVEAGEFTLIGATTEYPKTSVNKALLSRVQIIELKKLTEEALGKILLNTCSKYDLETSQEVIQLISRFSDGDARTALNTLEALDKAQELKDLEKARKIIDAHSRSYDKNGERHYDVISAFIKSMRGSDPDAALLWLAVMLDGGEDPVFIARRMVIFASEDIGNADPTALTLAVSGLTAVQNIGMPEARINLAQVTTYLASTVKSNASYMGINEALEYVRNNPSVEVPEHLKNTGSQSKNYQYPHSHEGHFVKQDYRPKEVPKFYSPNGLGTESKIKDRLEKLWN